MVASLQRAWRKAASGDGPVSNDDGDARPAVSSASSTGSRSTGWVTGGRKSSTRRGRGRPGAASPPMK